MATDQLIATGKVAHPLLGVGPGNYSDYIERYALGHPYGSAHGNYQQIAAETRPMIRELRPPYRSRTATSRS